MTDAAASKSEGGLRTTGARKQSLPGKPLVSVVTVVLNSEQTLEQTIQSVVSQSYDNIEYIVIDGGSRDNTVGILRKHTARIDYWMSEPDAGIYAAMNKGIGFARGDLINLLNADDYLEPRAVETVVADFLIQNRPCILYGNYRLIDERLGYQMEMASHLNVWLGMTISHQSMFVHKDIYALLGGYDTAYSLAADYDFLLRAMARNVKLVHTGIVEVSRRLHGRGGMNFLRSKRETNAINSLYFRGHVLRRLAFVVTCVIDTGKLIAIRTAHAVLGAVRTRALLLFYYRSRKIPCAPITDGFQKQS